MEVVVVSFDGSVQAADEAGQPMSVLIDLGDDRLRLSLGGVLVAAWHLRDVRITAQADGFHIRWAGQELIVNITQDAEFAVAVDLRSVPVGLARRMAVHRDSLRGVAGTESPAPLPTL